MELKITVNAITLQDETKSSEKRTVNTVRTVKEIYEFLEDTESEALSDKLHELRGEYLS